jgi:hypothetical protein
VPYSDKLVPTEASQSGERTWYVLRSQPVIRGTDMRDARASMDSLEHPITVFNLTADAGFPNKQVGLSGNAWQEGRTPPLSCLRPNRTKSVPNHGRNTAFSAYCLYKTSLESMAGGGMASV